MVPVELRFQIDETWSALRSGGMTNPLDVLDQLTYLLFLRRLDARHPIGANALRRPGQDPVFPDGKDGSGGDALPYDELRWSAFATRQAEQLYTVVDRHVFPFLRRLGASYPPAGVMREARLTIPTPDLLQAAVQLIDRVPSEAAAEAYEYLLGKALASGQQARFRTPRHIAELMVALVAPTPSDTIADPAVGTGGILVAAAKHLREHHAENGGESAGSNLGGYDSDAAMARIASLNLQLHGVDHPNIERRDTLTQRDGARCTVVLSTPPLGGSLDAAQPLSGEVKTKKSELLFPALALQMLAGGGRAAVIVPDTVLVGSSNAHKALRRMLVEDNRLDAVIRLPRGAFKPYSGASTSILIFTKDPAGTEQVWFYDIRADGFSLDNKRQPLLPPEGLGVYGVPIEDAVTDVPPSPPSKNDLPDVLARWIALRVPAADDSTAASLIEAAADGISLAPDREASDRAAEAARPRTAQSFLVPKDEIVGHDYDLSFNRYRLVEHAEVKYRAPAEILTELTALDAEIAHATRALAEVLQLDSSR